MDKEYFNFILTRIGFRIRELTLLYKDKVDAYTDLEEVSSVIFKSYLEDKAIYKRLEDLVCDFNNIEGNIKFTK